MIPLLHQQRKRLDELMTELSIALQIYAEASYDLDSKIDVLIDHALEYYQDAELPTIIAKLNICKCDIATLKRGYHPETFLKIEREKRNTQYSQMYRTLRQIEHIIGEDARKIKFKLDQAEELIEQLILNAMQLGRINEDMIRNRKSQDDLEHIWKTIGEEHSLNIFQKKIVVTCTFLDAIILLDIVFDHMSL